MENLLLKSLIERRDKMLSQVEILDSMIEEEVRKSGESIEDNQSVESIQRPLIRKEKSESFGKTDSEKFLGVLKKHKRFMRVREIANEVAIVEGGDIENWVVKLSRKTRKLQSINKIIKYQVGKSKSNVYWGSPNWLENGIIKKEFEYDRESINKKGASTIEDYEI